MHRERLAHVRLTRRLSGTGETREVGPHHASAPAPASFQGCGRRHLTRWGPAQDETESVAGPTGSRSCSRHRFWRQNFSKFTLTLRMPPFLRACECH